MVNFLIVYISFFCFVGERVCGIFYDDILEVKFLVLVFIIYEMNR